MGTTGSVEEEQIAEERVVHIFFSSAAKPNKMPNTKCAIDAFSPLSMSNAAKNIINGRESAKFANHTQCAMDGDAHLDVFHFL